MTRGERNNNPGNIRRVVGVTWVGAAADQSTDESFVVFTSPLYGIRAICRVMRSYGRAGLKTIHEIINRWAPPNENDSGAYVAAVCTSCNFGPDEIIDIEASMGQLIEAIIHHENGRCIYASWLIRQGINLA